MWRPRFEKNGPFNSQNKTLCGKPVSFLKFTPDFFFPFLPPCSGVFFVIHSIHLFSLWVKLVIHNQVLIVGMVIKFNKWLDCRVMWITHLTVLTHCGKRYLMCQKAVVAQLVAHWVEAAKERLNCFIRVPLGRAG